MSIYVWEICHAFMTPFPLDDPLSWWFFALAIAAALGLLGESEKKRRK